MAWGWDAGTLAGAEFDTVEEAITSLTVSVRQNAERYGTEQQSKALRNCVEPMRARIRSEGVQALAEGHDWLGECGGLYVKLAPQQQ